MNKSNTGAIWYLIITKIKAQIRNLMRKKTSFVLTLIGILVLGFATIKSLDNPTSIGSIFELDATILNSAGGVLLYLFLLIFVFNKATALVYENDANAIFVGPFDNKAIYTYLISSSILQSLLFGVGFVFYVMIFFNSVIKGFPHIFGIILSVTLHFILIVFYHMFEYIKEASKEFPKHINRSLVILVSVLIVGMILFILFPNFDLDSIKNISQHPLFKWIPLIGTFGWIGNMFVINDLSALIPIGLILVLSLYLSIRIFNFEGNFIEKAVTDAQFVSSRIKQVKDGADPFELDQNLEKINKRQIKSEFLRGGYALFSKQLLVLRKTRKLVSISMLIYVVIYGLIAVISKNPEFFMIFSVFGLFLGNDNTLLNDELRKPYIYLIPDNEFKKLISTLIIPFIRVALIQLINIGFMLFLGMSLVDSIIFFFFVLSCYFIILMVDCVSLKILKGAKNAILKSYINMGLYILALIPTGVILFGIFMLIPTLTLNNIFIIGIIMNILIGLIGLSFAKSILRGNNLVD